MTRQSRLAGLAGVSLLLLFWQWAEAATFPLHQRLPPPHHFPPLTLLKPLKGCDEETQTCLTSWLEQDYAGPVQYLLGVASADDPVCGLVKSLARAYPKRQIQLLICAERRATNGKISTLIQLQEHSAHELTVVSDADVRVPPDFLSQLVASWTSRPKTALVQCFYALTNPHGAAMRLEALAINADFWPQVLQARRLAPLDFALGAALLTDRGQLDSMGQFEALGDYLADDFQLGQRLARGGGRIILSPVVVECRHAPQGWREVWRHQLRWARTIRSCRPISYFFSVLNNVTLWNLLLLTGGAALPFAYRLVPCAMALLLRTLIALWSEKRLKTPASAPWMPVVKDLLQVLLWAQAFLGKTVHWRGEHFRIRAGGKLERLVLEYTAPRGLTCRTRQKGQVVTPEVWTPSEETANRREKSRDRGRTVPAGQRPVCQPGDEGALNRGKSGPPSVCHASYPKWHEFPGTAAPNPAAAANRCPGTLKSYDQLTAA